MSLIEVEALSYGYQGTERMVVHDISFTLDGGEVMCIIGPNGAGKSTLLNVMVGMLPASHGRVTLEGIDVSRMNRAHIARFIGYVTQSKTPSFGYSVIDYTVMGRAAHVALCKMPSSSDYERAWAGLRRMGVEDLAYRNYLELSGGERQQVDIARAIVQDPRLIILDEPTSALDFGNQAKVIDVVGQLRDEGYAVLLTTHDPNHAIMLGSKVGVLETGGAMVVGEAGEIISEEILSKTYRTDVRIEYMDKVKREVCTIMGTVPKTIT